MPPRVRSRFTRLFYWLVLLVSATLLFVVVWILLPVPDAVLLPLGVGAPELSPILLCAALVLTAVSGWYGRLLGTARLALVLSLVALVLSAIPLVQLRSTVLRFDAAMSSAFGPQPSAWPVNLAAVFRSPSEGNSHVIRAVEFARPSGVPLQLDIYKAEGVTGRSPVVIQIYGGAWQRGSPEDNSTFARRLASRGYVVVAIDYRHAPEWKWPAQRDDVRSAVRWVSAHAGEFDGDPERIAVLGRSSGGQLALVAGYDPANSGVRAIIDLYGPVDLAEGWTHPPRPDPLNVRDILQAFLGGTPASAAERYKQASPITYATRALPPTLMIYGARDHIVEARFGRQLERALKRSGTTAVLLEVPWSEHAFDVLPNGLGGQLTQYYVEAFLNSTLRPAAGPRRPGAR